MYWKKPSENLCKIPWKSYGRIIFLSKLRFWILAENKYHNFVNIIKIIITILKLFWKDGLEIFWEFPGKPKQLSVIQTKLWCNFTEITWPQRCFSGNIPNNFRTPF